MIGSSTSLQSIASTMNTAQNSSKNTSLSEEQQKFVSTLLASYDVSNLSENDAKSIVESLKNEGIEPGKSLEKAMSDSGFSAKEVGTLAGVGQNSGTQKGGGMPPPPPPSNSASLSEEDTSVISELLDSLLSIDESDTTTSSSTSFDDIMKYTSRIVNLNEQSQDKVMEILDKYTQDDTDLSKQDIQSIVKYNLNEILSNQDNYNRTSLLA